MREIHPISASWITRRWRCSHGRAAFEMLRFGCTKSSISACILLCEAGRVQKHQRRFGAMTQELQELAEWLRQLVRSR